MFKYWRWKKTRKTQKKIKNLVVALVDNHGRVIRRPVTCPTCGKKAMFVNKKEVMCRRCHNKDGTKGRMWEIEELIKTLRRVKYSDNLIFTESD